VRRTLHKNAEVGFTLAKTVACVKEQLHAMGIACQDCGKSGVTAMLGNKRKKRVILLRADMDGLPMYEATGESYACKTGNMHACGHDMHTAMLLGAAKLLKANETLLDGQVKLLFQPAEEILQGAKDVIESGVLKNPVPQAAIALHVSTATNLPTGTAVLSTRAISAPAADYFTIRITGKACHGATPHQGVDALLAAAQTVVGLQVLSSREQEIDDPFILTVGKLTAGNAGNALAERAELNGTLRAYTESTRERIKSRMREIVRAQCKSVGASAVVTFEGGCPALKNDPGLIQLAKSSVETLFGKDRVITTDGRGGGSEDFAYISQELPSAFIVLSAGQREQGYVYPLHHPKVRFDEDVLWRGSAFLAYFAHEWLKK
jgi:hippurate hydrolase